MKNSTNESFWVKIWSKSDQSETTIMKIAYAKYNIIANKMRRIFFKNFLTILPRSTHQEASIELSFV